jgi:hypothetical protein
MSDRRPVDLEDVLVRMVSIEKTIATSVEQQRAANLLAYAKIAPTRSDALRALQAARTHLNLSGESPDE